MKNNFCEFWFTIFTISLAFIITSLGIYIPHSDTILLVFTITFGGIIMLSISKIIKKGIK